MDIFSTILIALSLSADCFAVSLSGGATQIKLSKWGVLRVALAFGFFQFIMPIIGWLVGRSVVNFISGFDHWIAFGLLAIIGGRMIWESLRGEEEIKKEADITRGLLLITLALATSIDALAVGLSIAFLQINIIFSSALIGVVAFLVTSLGFWLGRRASTLLGKRAKLVGGIVLVLIGIRILVEHLILNPGF